MRRFFSIITVLLFLTVLSIPPLITLLTPDQKISWAEKRTLAPLPGFNWTPEAVRTFPGLFEKYYNDHFGLRDSLVFYQQLLSLKLFGVSSSEFVIIGRDGWLFFNGEGLSGLRGLLGLRHQSRFQLDSHQTTLISHRNWLAKRDISYLFLPIPNKMTVYPEYLPYRLQKYSGNSYYEQVVSFLKEQGKFTDFIDMESLFLEKKQEKQLYLKTDSHWNDYGAYLAYQNIIRETAARGIPVRELTGEDFSWTTTRYSGDLATFLHMAETLTETVPQAQSIAPCHDTVPSSTQREQNRDAFKAFAGDPRGFSMVQNCNDNDTTVLLIHDSFGNALKPYLSASFGTIFYVERGFNSVKDFIDQIRPDIVLDLRIERNLHLALEPDPEFEESLLKQQFLQSKTTLFQLKAAGGDTAYVHSPFARVTEAKDGLRIASDQEYPSLIFTSPQDNESSVVRVELSSKHDTDLLLYYTTEEHPEFSPEQIIKRPVKKGENDIYFRLPRSAPSGTLQFFPGKPPGRYTLHSFIIKS